MRNRTAVAAGVSCPLTDYGFGQDTSPRFQTVYRQRKYWHSAYTAAAKAVSSHRETAAPLAHFGWLLPLPYPICSSVESQRSP